MKNKQVISAVVGGTLFAIPYVGLAIGVIPSLAIGITGFVASELVLSGVTPKETLKNTDRNSYKRVMNAKKQNEEILKLVPKVENEKTKQNLNEIHNTVNKILTTIEKKPKKISQLDNFFDYYLPVLIKIVNRYDEVENQSLKSEDGASFIKKADKMINDTNNAFQKILSSLYEKDIMDVGADIEVYNLMLKADGIVDNNQIMKGSEKK
jgi:5-bromo-4-chloroindolyl phosphate hydrolysis protein